MKDAKGHGSNPRGGASGVTVNKYGQRVLPSVNQVPLGKLPGEEGVQASMARIGAADNAMGHLARIAQTHGITGGPFKVQALDTSLVGKPLRTVQSYKNRTIAETVAQRMRQDGGFMRIRSK